MDIAIRPLIRRARPADAEGIARVHVASWRATYRNLLPDDYLDALAVENRARFYRNRVVDPNTTSIAFVALEQQTIIGYVIGGPQHDATYDHDGEIYAIYLLPGYQRAGIGRRLVHAVAQALSERGCRSLLLWVLSTNQPARHFYEALGGTALGTKPLTIGSVTVTKVAYGWPALTDLIAATATATAMNGPMDEWTN